MDLPICTACGSQYDTDSSSSNPANCKICDDPRQFVPPTGQTWTTLSRLQTTHKTKWQRSPHNPSIWSLFTEPKFAIGQRAILLQTPHGNILWDCITLLDPATTAFIHSLGGLAAIVISHPHYYTTYSTWSAAFACPVHISADDRAWLCQPPPSPQTLALIDGPAGTTTPILDGGVTAIKTGGHFPGSLVLHWDSQLFIADTIVTVPSAHTPHPRPPGQTSFVFQWSIPNCIPLPPDEILKIWKAIRGFAFHTTYGAFVGAEVRDERLKARVLESMKIQVRGEGWERHEILDEPVPVGE